MSTYWNRVSSVPPRPSPRQGETTFEARLISGKCHFVSTRERTDELLDTPFFPPQLGAVITNVHNSIEGKKEEV